MTEDVVSNEPLDPTDVRYSTRSLLAAMVAVAVACTGLSALFRSLPVDDWPKLALHWLILLLLSAAFVGYNARRRYVAEKQAGIVRFRLAPHSYFLPRVPAIARILLGTLLMLYAPFVWIGTSFLIVQENTPVWAELINWHTYFSVFVSASGLNHLWWHRTLRLADRGVVVRHRFVPWSACRGWYWDAVYRDVIVLEYNQSEKVALRAPEEQRDAIEAFVNRQRYDKPRAAK
jgi:hypothetical protein